MWCMTDSMMDGDAAAIVVAPLDLQLHACRAAEAVLSPAERARADRFVRACDRRRFVVARARLRHLLGERLNTSPRAVRFAYGPAGKPALAPHHGPTTLRFNVSHCGDVAAFVLMDGCEVGIDIEEVRPLPDADDIAALVFSERERIAYRALPPAAKFSGFFNGWTRKEAFVKAVGDGLGYPLDQFDVSLAPGEPACLLRVGGQPADRVPWALRAFEPAPGMVGAIVVGTRRAFAPRDR
jgi:4'-phosphopantetheinyl transferase